MADPKQIEQELKEFLEKSDNMRKSDIILGVVAVVNKHFELDKIDHMINYYDFGQIISYAKCEYPKATMPVFINRKEVHQTEVNYVLIMEAFVSYLNKNKLLKRLVKFDYRR